MDGAGTLLERAHAAAGSGDFEAAAELLRDAMAESDDPAAYVLLGALRYGDHALDDARAAWEAAFRGFAARSDLPKAARAACLLGELHWTLGNEATGRGWLERARALLEEAGPCVEWGYWELALMACERPDADELARSAARAREIARQHGDLALEVRALADGGYALVTQGRLREGFAQLDQALAALTSGEVRDPFVVSTAFCSLLSSCDRAGDVERATEWTRVVRDLVLAPTGDRPRVLSNHCRLAFGSVLCAAGRWPDGEAALLDAADPAAPASAGHRVDAIARLAELRIEQGRVDEAAALLAPIEDQLSAAGPLARVHLERGDPALAVAVVLPAVRRLTGDVLRGAPLVATLVEAQLALGDRSAAADALRLLQAMAATVDAPVVAALAALSQARAARADGELDAAARSLEAALAALEAVERPVLAVTVRLELAAVHAAAGDTNAAVACARAAHATARRVGAAACTDRSAALLRALGATPPRSPGAAADTLAGLTARELDVLDGIRRGNTNVEIAAALYLSPKTVEHHVSRLLAKLGVRTRAEAAALAAAARVGDQGAR